MHPMSVTQCTGQGSYVDPVQGNTVSTDDCTTSFPTDPGFNNCVIGCNPGYPTGGGSPLGSGGVAGPAGLGNQVAITSGPPTTNATCQANDGQNSLAVGTTVGYANVNGQPTAARSVKDINALYGYSGMNIRGGNGYTNLQTIGWVYEDNNGAYWFQENQNIAWTYSFGLGITAGDLIGASFGINSPPGKAAVSIGSTPGKLQSHETASPCFSEGAQFFPGEIA